MHEDDAPVTRDEINRLWADLSALTTLVATDTGARWGAARVDDWYNKRALAIESMNDAPEITANSIRALGKLSTLLRGAAQNAGTS